MTVDCAPFQTIILITGEVEHPILADVLRRHNAALTIQAVTTAADLAGLDRSVLASSRIVAFSTNVLVPGDILAATGWGAYNFHPGSPAFPGWAPAAFAAYDGASRFGATAHVMTARIDAGAIIATELFDVPDRCTPLRLAELAYAALARLFWSLAEDLANHAAPLPTLPTPWGNKCGTRRAFAQLCDIPADIEAAELARRVEAFGDGDGMTRPTVTLHGHRFRLE